MIRLDFIGLEWKKKQQRETRVNQRSNKVVARGETQKKLKRVDL